MMKSQSFGLECSSTKHTQQELVSAETVFPDFVYFLQSTAQDRIVT